MLVGLKQNCIQTMLQFWNHEIIFNKSPQMFLSYVSFFQLMSVIMKNSLYCFKIFL